MSGANDQIETFIADWIITGGSELANTQSFVNGLAALIGVDPPKGSQPDDAQNDYVFERRVFQDNGDGTTSFGRLDAYKRDCFVLEAKQGTDADREAAKRGEADFFGKPAAEKLKQGTAKRGTPGWAAAMLKAKGQAERYAKALPIDHGWPPFLLVTDVGHCIDVYADFSGTGKQYSQFPDAARFRIKLEDLRDAEVRTRLATIWTAPLSLDPSKEAARVTREIAGHLAELSKRLEKREQNPTRVADFLMRCLFTMFAEDVALIPGGSFTALLEKLKTRPENFVPQVTALWQAMDTGGFVGALGEAGEAVRRFNGYLFKDTSVIALQPEEIGLLIEAAKHKWNHVEPAIFGTLLERALDGKERAKLGAHYTPRAYVERLVMPTVIEPLRADWAGVQAAAASLIEADKADEARAVVEKFHGALAQTKVLDPACGTGNFLYVALARMKELEGEVVSLLTELGDMDYVLGLSGHTITPENFLGIEINPRAAAIAQLVLWIGYLQWHFRVSGEGRMPPEPVLRDVKTIENRDALITWDKKVLERDEHGKPLTRWDGETMKVDPVTGEKVPDGDSRVEVERYVKPKITKWPKADFIIGNPPFVSSRETRELLGDGYADALRAAIPDVPGNVDLVMYFWKAAADQVRSKTRQFGLITTSRIRMEQNREVVFKALGQDLNIEFAIPDHPWAGKDAEAGVRVAFTTISKSSRQPKRLFLAPDHDDSKNRVSDGTILSEKDLTEFVREAISADLSPSIKVDDVKELKAWNRLSHAGMKPYAESLVLDDARAQSLFSDGETLNRYAPRYLNGQDVARHPRNVRVLDFNSCARETDVRAISEPAYQYLFTHTKQERSQERNLRLRNEWWRFEAARDELRAGIKSLNRYIATVENSPIRYFVFLSSTMLPDQKLRCLASDDAYLLGVLSTRYHAVFSARIGGRHGVGNTPVYNTKCVTTFPFPADVPDALKARIRAEAEALDGLRKTVLETHADLTLTGLYNVLEALKAGRALTDKERDVHDRGLVTLIRQHHDAIDAAVAEAYGWPADLSDEDILTRLVALNRTRADEEAKGIIRWLRPEFQAPGATAPQVNATLDLGEAPAAASASVIPWPKTMAEQITAVAAILAASPAPQHPRDIARAFDGKRAASVTPVLDALTAIGQARRLADGRYAA
jgi:hypothetical protein